MIVNSDDDFVCLPSNVREDIVEGFEGSLLIRTNKGAHIAFNEGLFG